MFRELLIVAHTQTPALQTTLLAAFRLAVRLVFGKLGICRLRLLLISQHAGGLLLYWRCRLFLGPNGCTDLGVYSLDRVNVCDVLPSKDE